MYTMSYVDYLSLYIYGCLHLYTSCSFGWFKPKGSLKSKSPEIKNPKLNVLNLICTHAYVLVNICCIPELGMWMKYEILFTVNLIIHLILPLDVLGRLLNLPLNASLLDVVNFSLSLGHSTAWAQRVEQAVITDCTPNVMLCSDLGPNGDRGTWVAHWEKCTFIGGVSQPALHTVRRQESDEAWWQIVEATAETGGPFTSGCLRVNWRGNIAGLSGDDGGSHFQLVLRIVLFY